MNTADLLRKSRPKPTTSRYFDEGSEYCAFTENDILDIEAVAQECLAANDAKEQRGVSRKGANIGERTLAMEMRRVQGEWAVADSLGVVRPIGEMGVADDGYDLQAGTTTIDVKTGEKSDASLCLETYKQTSPLRPDLYVLVVRTDDPAVLRIVGGVEFSYFWRTARPAHFLEAPNVYLDQSELMPWSGLKKALVTP